MFVLFTAQLWRLTNESKLESLYSSSWEFDNKTWTIPTEDKEDYIKVTQGLNSGKVLAVSGEDVVLEDITENSKSSHLWIKGSENSDGYFSLKNKETGKYLTVFTYTCKY